MRHGRAKAARKTLKFFALNGNIKPPYKVILDGNFLVAIMKHKVRIARVCSNLFHQTVSFLRYRWKRFITAQVHLFGILMDKISFVFPQISETAYFFYRFQSTIDCEKLSKRIKLFFMSPDPL